MFRHSGFGKSSFCKSESSAIVLAKEISLEHDSGRVKTAVGKAILRAGEGRFARQKKLLGRREIRALEEGRRPAEEGSSDDSSDAPAGCRKRFLLPLVVMFIIIFFLCVLWSLGRPGDYYYWYHFYNLPRPRPN
jgi:hypothetical protein